MYRLLRGRTFSENLPKISRFVPSLIHQLRLLGSQQHMQGWVLLTSFSSWGIENSLAEINLESTGGEIKDCNVFGVKNWQILAALWAGALSCNKKNTSIAECSWTKPLNALQEAIHYSFIKFRIYWFSLWHEFFVHYALRVEKIYQHDLDAEPFEFQFFSAEGMSHQPIHKSVALFQGHRHNTTSPLPQ